MGFTDAARRAGNKQAAIESSSTSTAASASTSGSIALTPNTSDPINREAATAPTRPIAHPIPASFAPEIRIRRTIPVRCDPNAMRIAISGTRSATENAMTL